METSSGQMSQPAGSGASATPGAGLTDEIKHQASGLAEQAKAKAKEAAQSGQTAAADQLEHLAQGVRRSAENFPDDQAWVKEGLSTAAESIERFSSTLRDRDLGSLLSDAEDAARRHPVVFCAACAVAGFALVRFLKSSSEHPAHHRASNSRSGAYRASGSSYGATATVSGSSSAASADRPSSSY